MTTTFDRMVRAMQASPAWPAVFDVGSARVLLIAALREAMEPDDALLEAVIDCLHTHFDQSVAFPGEYAAWRVGIDHILSEAEG